MKDEKEEFDGPLVDERWADPEGVEWQVVNAPVIRDRDIRKGGEVVDQTPLRLAFVLMRGPDGTEEKFTAAQFEGWSRAADPLTDTRRKISSEVRSGSKVLIWPAVDENGVTIVAPVRKGDRFTVPGVPVVEIDKVSRRLPAGRKAEWHVTFIRLEVDRPQLLRRVPSGVPDGPGRSTGGDDIERARIESGYTSSPQQSLDREPESVGAKWEDNGAAEREVQRVLDRREIMNQEDELLKAATRLKQVGKQSSRKGRDLTYFLRDIYDRLAEEERELRDAA